MKNTFKVFQKFFVNLHRPTLHLNNQISVSRIHILFLNHKLGLAPSRSAPLFFVVSRRSFAVTMPPKHKAEGEDDSEGAKKPKTGGTEANTLPDDANTLEANTDKKTESGQTWNLKISSWNVNGLRAWVKKDGLKYITLEDPDILCLQETKCNEKSIPKECNIDGYHNYWYEAEKPGYAGTAIMSKVKPVNVTFGIGCDEHDKEGRVITAEYDKFYLVTAYVPNAGKKLVRLDYRGEWDKDFRNYLVELDKKKPVVLCGDLNVSHKEIDLANPKTNRNKTAGFSDQERQGFTDLLEAGFVDSYRQLYPEKTAEYSFWTYMMNARAKNTGWRLDYFVISEKLQANLCDSLIRTKIYGSDHCPVTLFLAM